MEKKWRERCLDLLLTAGVAVIGIFLVKKLFFLILPIFFGYLFSEGVRKSFQKLKPMSDPIRKTLIILVLMILFALLSLILVLAAERVLTGITALGQSLEASSRGLVSLLQDLMERCGKALSRILHRDVEGQFAALVPELLREGAKQLAAALPGVVGSLAAGVPTLFFSLIIFLFCSYYFSCEWDRARALFHRLCPREHRETVLRHKAGFLRGLKKILRAYGIIFALSFLQLFAGLWIIGVENPAGKALLVAVVDILPILGSGTVLVPWGIFLLIRGEVSRGVGLLILYLVILLIRQFLEPRIVGRSIGLHPIVSLILMLGGLVLFGVWGMLLSPLLAACLLEGAKAEEAA